MSKPGFTRLLCSNGLSFGAVGWQSPNDFRVSEGGVCTLPMTRAGVGGRGDIYSTVTVTVALFWPKRL